MENNFHGGLVKPSVHQMLAVDRQTRLNYPQVIMNLDHEDDNFSSKMIMSQQTHFHLSGYVNRAIIPVHSYCWRYHRVSFVRKCRGINDWCRRRTLQSHARRISPFSNTWIGTLENVIPTGWSEGAYCTSDNWNSEGCLSGYPNLSFCRFELSSNIARFNNSNLLFVGFF